MSYLWFTEEWAQACSDQINQSTAYAEAASSWEWPLILTLQQDTNSDVLENRSVYLDLWQGTCRNAHIASAQDISTAEFHISADAETWKNVLGGKQDPIMSIMMGKLTLVKGNITTLAGYVKAAKAMVEAAGKVEIRYS